MKTHKTPSYHRRLDRLVTHRIKTHRRYKSIKEKFVFRFIVSEERRLINSDSVEYSALFMGSYSALLNSDCGLHKLINDLLNQTNCFASGNGYAANQIECSTTSCIINLSCFRPQSDSILPSTVSALEGVCTHRPRDSDLYVKN